MSEVRKLSLREITLPRVTQLPSGKARVKTRVSNSIMVKSLVSEVRKIYNKVLVLSLTKSVICTNLPKSVASIPSFVK